MPSRSPRNRRAADPPPRPSPAPSTGAKPAVAEAQRTDAAPPRPPTLRPTDRALHAAPWLVAVTALCVAVFFAARRPPPAATAPVAPVAPEPPPEAGPWGRLERVAFHLEQPHSHLSPSACSTETPAWVLPGMTAAALPGTLANAGLTAPQVAALARDARCEPAGCVLRPTEDVVLGLSPAARSTLYGELGRFPQNVAQAFPFSRPASDPRWSELAGVVDLALIERLSWRRGGEVYLSDLQVLCARLGADDARRRLLETLSRMSAVMAWVVVPPGADVDALVAYWGRGAITRDLRPMFAALATQPDGGRLDVVHLLPPFARRRLNTFPRPSDPPRDCYWSALNFFALDAPPDSFVDGAGVQAALARDYTRVPWEDRRYGDVVLFVEPGRGPVHAVNYIADDLVFSKNGNHYRRPWSLVPLSEVRDTYPDARDLRVYRLRSFPTYGGG